MVESFPRTHKAQLLLSQEERQAGEVGMTQSVKYCPANIRTCVQSPDENATDFYNWGHVHL